MSDFDRYATGYQLLDWLTAPYWHFKGWRSLRRLDRALGITGSRQERREQRRELWRPVGVEIEPEPCDCPWCNQCGQALMRGAFIEGYCTSPRGHEGMHAFMEAIR